MTNERIAWLAAARDHLRNAQEYWHDGDIEGAWVCLHAAQRTALFGLTKEELRDRQRTLRHEAAKVSGWRGEAIKELLDQNRPSSVERLAAAAALRDERAANEYHKIWLLGDELKLLLALCGGGAVVFTPSITFLSQEGGAWNPSMIAGVLLLGLLGAGYSAAQSLLKLTAETKIPQRVANRYVTIARFLAWSSVSQGTRSCNRACSASQSWTATLVPRSRSRFCSGTPGSVPLPVLRDRLAVATSTAKRLVVAAIEIARAFRPEEDEGTECHMQLHEHLGATLTSTGCFLYPGAARATRSLSRGRTRMGTCTSTCRSGAW
jgi:hypothetical protein